MTALALRRGNFFVDEARREMENLFQRFFGPVAEINGESKPFTWNPSVDVSETDKEILVHAELPGVDPKQVDISVKDGVLTIKGEKKEQKEEKGKTFLKSERFFGSFYRQFPLPSGIDEDAIAATTANGTITITIPKKPGAQPKKVTVKPTTA